MKWPKYIQIASCVTSTKGDFAESVIYLKPSLKTKNIRYKF